MKKRKFVIYIKKRKIYLYGMTDSNHLPNN